MFGVIAIFEERVINMTTNERLDIHHALREVQNKYTYFLLAVVGAAIALVINQTKDATLKWPQLPLAAAVLSWALSFFFGCRNLSYIKAGLRTNAALLDAKAGLNELVGTNPEAFKIADKTLRKIFEDQSKQANFFANMQFRFLIAGAVLYVVWHIFEMYLRTI